MNNYILLSNTGICMSL